MDPLPYHSSFDALVIPRRLFDELEISLKHNVNGSALAHVNLTKSPMRGGGSTSGETVGTSNGTLPSMKQVSGPRKSGSGGFKMYKTSTWSS